MSKFIQLAGHDTIAQFRRCAAHGNQLFYVDHYNGKIQYFTEGDAAWGGVIPTVVPPIIGGYWLDCVSFEGDLYGAADGALYRLDWVPPNWIPTLVCNRLNDQFVNLLKVYDGRLYGITYSNNPLEPGGRLYRMNLTKDAWEQVADTWSEENYVWVEEFNGLIYAMGINGELVVYDPTGPSWAVTIAVCPTDLYRIMIVHDSVFYLMASGWLPRIYTLNLIDGTCDLLLDFSTLAPPFSLYTIIWPISYQGRMFLGTFANIAGYGNLLYYDNINNSIKLVCDELNSQRYIHAPIVLNDILYFGTYDVVGTGGRLFECDINIISQIVKSPDIILKPNQKIKFDALTYVEGPTP